MALSVGEPFLEDLVAAQFVVSDGGWDILPVGAVVEVYVKGGPSQGGNGVGKRGACAGGEVSASHGHGGMRSWFGTKWR